MANAMMCDKDIAHFIDNVLNFHPGGVLVMGAPGTGKTQVQRSLSLERPSLRVYDLDDYGHWVGKKWSVDWNAVPKDWQVLVGSPSNIEGILANSTKEFAIVVLTRPIPEWRKTIRERLDTHKDGSVMDEYYREWLQDVHAPSDSLFKYFNSKAHSISGGKRRIYNVEMRMPKSPTPHLMSA